MRKYACKIKFMGFIILFALLLISCKKQESQQGLVEEIKESQETGESTETFDDGTKVTTETFRTQGDDGEVTNQQVITTTSVDGTISKETTEKLIVWK